MSWSVLVAGVDRTTYVQPFTSLQVENRAFAGSGVATVPIRISDGSWTPANEDSLTILNDGVEIFDGYVRTVTRGDDGYSTGPKTFVLNGQDFTTLLDDDVIDTAYRSATESDKARITWLIQTWGTRGVTAGTNVQQTLATMPLGTDGKAEQDFSGKTLREAVDQVCAITGATYYVDYNKDMHYFLSESNAAPFALSDTPNNTSTFSYGNLTLTDDSVDLVHEVLVVGNTIKQWVAVGSPPPLGSRRRAVLRDDTIDSAAQATQAGNAFLAEYGTAKRSGSLTTWRAGLRAGQTVQITHQGMGLSGTSFRITSVIAKPNGAKVEYRVEFGTEKDDLASVVGGVARQVDTVQSLITPTIQRQVMSLQSGGANLVPNSDFENGTDWTVGSLWVIGTVEAGVSGTKIARADTTGTNAGNLTLTNRIPVDRLADYWISWWSKVSNRTAGSARVQLVEYNASNTVVATTTLLDVSANESAWTRHSYHYGPNDQVGRTAFNAATTQINLIFTTTGSSNLIFRVDGVQVEQGSILTAYAPAPYELMDGQITETQIADDSITTPKLAANAVVAGKVAAGAITAETLAAQLILASLIKTANTGARIEMDPLGVRAYDSSGVLLVNIPSDGSPVYIKAELNAVNLTSEMAELRGATSVPKDAVVSLQAGIIAPQAPPNLSAGWPSTAFTKPSISNFEVVGGSYDALGGADGLTPCYIALVKNTSTNLVYVYEWKLADGTISRITSIALTPDLPYNSGFIVRLGTNWFVCWGKTSGIPRTYLSKFNRSDGSRVSSFDVGADFDLQTELGRPIKTDGTSLYVLNSDDAVTNGALEIVKYNTSLAKQSTVALTEPTVTGDSISPYAWSFEVVGTDAWVEVRQVNDSAYTSQRLYQFTLSTGARTSNTDFPKVSTADLGGFFWDGTNFRHEVGKSTTPTLYTYTNWTWTTSTPIYYAGYSWYDSNATGGTHETDMGPLKSITMDRRQQLTVSTASVPGSGGTDDPDQRRIYMLRSATLPVYGTLHRQSTTSATSVILTDYNGAGAADPTTNTFPASTPGKIANASPTYGSYSLRGDGHVNIDGIKGSVWLHDEGAGGEDPALMVTYTAGAPKSGGSYGTRMDAYEIDFYPSTWSSIFDMDTYIYRSAAGILAMDAGRIDAPSMWPHEAANIRNGSSAGSNYPTGLSMMAITSSTDTGWPFADGRGTVVTLNSGTTLIHQVWFRRGSLGNSVWGRNWDSAGLVWGAWREMTN